MADTKTKDSSATTIIALVIGMILNAFRRKMPDDPPGEPTRPGELLQEIILKNMGMSPAQLSKSAGISDDQLKKIFNGTARITPDIVRKLEPVIGSGAELLYFVQAGRDYFDATGKWPASPTPEKAKKLRDELKG